MTTLTVNHLRVMRGQKSVVDDVSLRLETGRITALLGPNGAGKSSLVHVLAGLLPAAEGRIESDGASLVGRSPEAIRGAGIAAVLEGHRVLSGLSVDDNLQAAGFNHSRVTLKAAVGEVYDIFPELAERKGQRPARCPVDNSKCCRSGRPSCAGRSSSSPTKCRWDSRP